MRRGQRRPAHREAGEAPPGVALHFWPGEHRAAETPGAILPCGSKATPPLATWETPKVTCKRCRRWLAAHGLDRPALGDCRWHRDDLERFGLLDPTAPEWQPRPAPYRNPRTPAYNRDAPSPLAQLADDLADAAERARQAGNVEAFTVLRSFAARAVDLHERSKPGASW